MARVDTMSESWWRIQVRDGEGGRVVYETQGRDEDLIKHEFWALTLPGELCAELQHRPAGRSRFSTVDARG